MIPKIVHYCWFGRGPLPQETLRCMDSWRKYLPDYRLMRWDEDNFDVGSLKFTRQAYERRKYAFVSDYVRMHALKTYGGVYLDTDVEMVRGLDDLLELPAFAGFETSEFIATCLLGSEPGAAWLDVMLDYYARKPFVRWNGRLNRTPNTHILARRLGKLGVRLDNSRQVFRDELHLFPSDYFNPKSYVTWETVCTENTRCIHHFAGSWK